MNGITKEIVEKKKKLHPLLLKLMSFINNYKIVMLSELNVDKKTPVIFVFNHSNMFDIPYVSKIIKEHFYLLASDEVEHSMGGLLFKLNGVVFINRNDKDSRQESLSELESVLDSNTNVLIFPEGKWNLSSNKPMLPLGTGAIRLAQNTNTIIVPIAIEYINDELLVNPGKEFIVNRNDDINEKCIELRDVLSTLKWNIWEREESNNRSYEEFNEYVNDILSKRPKKNSVIEEDVIFTYDKERENVFSSIDSLKLTKKNAFLFGKNNNK